MDAMSESDRMDELINELMGESIPKPIEIPKKYAPIKKQSSRRCKVHKYIRFRSNNKTYDINKYYCTNCPSTINIPEILGRTTECWKCKKAFTVGINYFPTKPACDSCRGDKDKNSLVNELFNEIDERLK